MEQLLLSLFGPMALGHKLREYGELQQFLEISEELNEHLSRGGRFHIFCGQSQI